MAENSPENQSGGVYDDHDYPLTSDQSEVSQLRQREAAGVRPGGSSTSTGSTTGTDSRRRSGSTSSTNAGGGGGSSSTSSTGGGASSTNTSGGEGGESTSTQGDSPVTTKLADQEASPRGLFNPETSSTTGGINTRNIKSFVWGSTSRRRKTIFATITGVTVGGGLFGLTFFSGPLQFVHFAQLLQHWHLRSNEDFGDNRASKVLLYSVAGFGVENTRLGIIGNKAANAWEKKLLSDTGLRPVYSAKTRRFVGFAIMDENKTFNTLLDNSDRNDKTSANIDRAMGKGAEITTAGEASVGKQDIVFGGAGEPVPDSTRILSVANVKSYVERARFISTIGKFTDTNRLVSSIGSRLLKARAGVDFHLLKNVVRKATDSAADYATKERKAVAQEQATGTEPKTVADNPAKDSKGNPVATPADQTATVTADEAIKEAEQSVGRNTIKQIAAKVGTGTAVVGIFCAVKSFGNNIVDYKYTNDALVMERMGMDAITVGNEVMSNQGFNINELNAQSQSLYDSSNHTSWIGARSVEAEMGKTLNGPDLPPEAQLANVNNKPAFFNAIDSIPFLNIGCSLSGILGSIPIIGSIVNIGSQAIVSGLDSVIGLFGTSIEGIVQSALAAAAGKSVDTLAQGAAYGNLANTGAFLAGVDNSVTMGGAPLTPVQTGALKTEQTIADAEATSNESLAQRYLDPYSNTSLVGSLIDRVPSSTSTTLSSVSNDMASFFSGGLGKIAGSLIPHAHAAVTPYDYGLPNYGFTLDDQQNPEFENPYDNAAIIEAPGVLDNLNQKYGKTCFGMTVTDTATGVSVQTETMGSADLNVFKVQKDHGDTCDPSKNTDPMFLRYRFYLADAVTAESLACYEADDSQSCSDLGIDSSGSSDQTSGTGNGSTTPASSSAQQLAQQILDISKTGKISFAVVNPANVQDDSTAQDNIQDTVKGIQARTSTSCLGGGTPATNSTAALSPVLLQFLVDLSKQTSFTINELVGGCHVATSNHYKGTAVDFGCPFDPTAADALGKPNNIFDGVGETCSSGAGHYHYSIGGN